MGKTNRLVLFLVLGFGLGLITGGVKAQYDPNYPEPIGKLPGSLFIVGGGRMSEAMWDRFVELAGGTNARIVVIPTASENADELAGSPEKVEKYLELWRRRNVASVALLHARRREQADDASFLEPLRQATGVWFGGGQQERIANAYVGTAVEQALKDVLLRNGVLGGTSAGAAVMSRVMIAGGNPRARLARGFDLLPSSVVDQHFLARNRQPRLLGVLRDQPGLAGFGIDEGTAMIVRGRSIEVMGESAVVACLAEGPGRAGRPDQLKAGDHADLIALTRAAAARACPPFPPPMPEPPQVRNGSLVIVGGGAMPKGLLERFVELAGGPDAPLVYVPCTPDEVIPKEPAFVETLRKAGASNVSWIHTKDRHRANTDQEFLEPLQNARGIWFGGGRQWNLVDSYQNTTAHRLMHEVLDRGGVIGGSSAGASIQGDYMPRGDPLGNLNIIAEGYERGLGFITGVAIDQHFSQRKRFADLSLLVQTYPQLLGLGIDEGTALVVRHSVADVVGAGQVAIYDATHKNSTDDTEDGNGKDHISLKAGQRYDLKLRRVVE